MVAPTNYGKVEGVSRRGKMGFHQGPRTKIHDVIYVYEATVNCICRNKVILIKAMVHLQALVILVKEMDNEFGRITMVLLANISMVIIM